MCTCVLQKFIHIYIVHMSQVYIHLYTCTHACNMDIRYPYIYIYIYTGSPIPRGSKGCPRPMLITPRRVPGSVAGSYNADYTLACASQWCWLIQHDTTLAVMPDIACVVKPACKYTTTASLCSNVCAAPLSMMFFAGDSAPVWSNHGRYGIWSLGGGCQMTCRHLYSIPGAHETSPCNPTPAGA